MPREVHISRIAPVTILPSYRYPNGWFVGQGSKRIGYLTVLATASMSAICQMTDFKGGVSTVKKAS